MVVTDGIDLVPLSQLPQQADDATGIVQLYSQTCVKRPYKTINIFGFSDACHGTLLMHESFLHFFHSAMSNHLSIEISMSPEWMVA